MKQIIEVLIKVGGVGFLIVTLYESGRTIDELVNEYLENKDSNKN